MKPKFTYNLPDGQFTWEDVIRAFDERYPNVEVRIVAERPFDPEKPRYVISITGNFPTKQEMYQHQSPSSVARVVRLLKLVGFELNVNLQ
jgi:hypothetical protein